MQILKLKKAEQVEEKIRTCAYCRVSSLSDMQEMSLENQISTYDRLIKSNPKYEFIKIYYDQGTSGSKENRKGLNEMLNDARKGLFDLIITKSISRFARNTVIVLKYVRELKELGVGVIFEDNNINTLSYEGEVMLSVLSAIAQEELRSTSDNLKWSIRRQYKSGNTKIRYQGMYGYFIDEYGNFAINTEQAKVVKRVFSMYLSGMGAKKIADKLNLENIPTYKNKKWSTRTILDMLKNEKYKGDALLQKSYTQDFLSKKRVKNDGEVQMYYIEEDHEAIISPKVWQAVQLERERRKDFLKKFNLSMYASQPEIRPFVSKVICGNCKKPYSRKRWKTKEGSARIVWQCSERYKVKGVMGCSNRHIDEEVLEKAVIIAWNEICDNREEYLNVWNEQMENANELESYVAERFKEYSLERVEKLSYEFILKILSYIEIYENGSIVVNFLDRTKIELISD